MQLTRIFHLLRAVTLLTAFALAFSGVMAVNAQVGEDDQEFGAGFGGEEVGVGELAQNADEFVGEQVMVTGATVGEEIQREAFVLEADGEQFLVVGDRTAIPRNLGDEVDVIGEVREGLDVRDIEQELGIELNDRELREFRDQPFLVAEDVRTAAVPELGQEETFGNEALLQDIERFCQDFQERFGGESEFGFFGGGEDESMDEPFRLAREVERFCQRIEEDFGPFGGAAAAGGVGAAGLAEVGEITEQPEGFIGETARVRGDVGDTLGERGFLLQDNGEILVFTPTGVSPDELGNGPVEVIGPVEEFNRRQVERELGITLDRQEFREFEGQPFIMAETIGTDEDEDNLFGEEQDDQLFGGEEEQTDGLGAEEEEDGGFFDFDFFGGDEDEDVQ